MVNLQLQKFNSLHKVHNKLSLKFEGQFLIVKCVSKSPYKLQLPASL